MGAPSTEKDKALEDLVRVMNRVRKRKNGVATRELCDMSEGTIEAILKLAVALAAAHDPFDTALANTIAAAQVLAQQRIPEQ